MKKQLKAFSLTETLVAMLISSLAIGFGYTAYSMISQNLFNHKNIGSHINEISLFSNVFENDLFYADSILFTNNRLEFLKNILQNENYRLSNNNLIREKGTALDTFFINAEKIDTNRIAGTDIIEQIIISYEWEGEKRKLVFNKQYGADRLLYFDTLYINP